jgi:hypothetical protein
MKVIVAPDHANIDRPALYLLGGITGCPDWQSLVCKKLQSASKGTIFNPRREYFERTEVSLREQANWAYLAAWTSNVLAFWFSEGESQQAIATFELGLHLGRYMAGIGTKIVVGVHPSYVNRRELEMQIEMINLNFHGPWRLSLIPDLDTFVAKIADTLSIVG